MELCECTGFIEFSRDEHGTLTTACRGHFDSKLKKALACDFVLPLCLPRLELKLPFVYESLREEQLDEAPQTCGLKIVARGKKQKESSSSDGSLLFGIAEKDCVFEMCTCLGRLCHKGHSVKRLLLEQSHAQALSGLSGTKKMEYVSNMGVQASRSTVMRQFQDICDEKKEQSRAHIFPMAEEWVALNDNSVVTLVNCLDGQYFIRVLRSGGPSTFKEAVREPWGMSCAPMSLGERDTKSAKDGKDGKDASEKVFYESETFEAICFIAGSVVEIFKTVAARILGYDGAVCRTKEDQRNDKLILLLFEMLIAFENRWAILPLLNCISRSESKVNFELAFRTAKIAGLDLDDDSILGFSDRGKGGIAGAKSAVPNMPQRFCSTHLERNIESNGSGAWSSGAFYGMLKSYSLAEYEVKREELLSSVGDDERREYVTNLDPNTFATCFFVKQGISTFGFHSNNFTEFENNRQKFVRLNRRRLPKSFMDCRYRWERQYPLFTRLSKGIPGFSFHGQWQSWRQAVSMRLVGVPK